MFMDNIVFKVPTMNIIAMGYQPFLYTTRDGVAVQLSYIGMIGFWPRPNSCESLIASFSCWYSFVIIAVFNLATIASDKYHIHIGPPPLLNVLKIH